MTLTVTRGDITKVQTDAIVNAANKTLLGGGGVDGAIHRAAGKELLKECRIIGGCPTGEARITKAYNLPVQYIIHTVGPIWKGGNHGEPELLASCYKNTLLLATTYDIKTIAFPNISTGIYRFPKNSATQIAIETVQSFVNEYPVFDKIIFVCFDEENYQLYNNYLNKNNTL